MQEQVASSDLKYLFIKLNLNIYISMSFWIKLHLPNSKIRFQQEKHLTPNFFKLEGWLKHYRKEKPEDMTHLKIIFS